MLPVGYVGQALMRLWQLRNVSLSITHTYWMYMYIGTIQYVLGIKQRSQETYERVMYKIIRCNYHRNVKRYKHVWNICSVCTMNLKFKVCFHICLFCKSILFCLSCNIDLWSEGFVTATEFCLCRTRQACKVEECENKSLVWFFWCKLNICFN
jgi:hypothetical protein